MGDSLSQIGGNIFAVMLVKNFRYTIARMAMAPPRQLKVLPPVVPALVTYVPQTASGSDPVPHALWAAVGLAAGMMATMMAKPSSLRHAAKADEAHQTVDEGSASSADLHEALRGLRTGHAIERSDFKGEDWECEDRAVDGLVLSVSELGVEASCIAFAIFDGHGGKGCAEYATENLIQNISASLLEKKKMSTKNCALTLKPAIRSGFKETEANWLKRQDTILDYSGCTACFVLLYGPDEKEQLQLFCGNLGDSRAIIGKSSGAVVALTEDHRYSTPKERQRAVAGGGTIIDDDGLLRCLGGKGQMRRAFAVSRALGDFDFKPDMVSGVPDISNYKLDSDTDEVLIIASDGIWDFLSDEEAVGVVLKALRQDPNSLPQEERARGETRAARASRKLIEAALAGGSEDDRSAIVVHFGWRA